MPPYSPVPDISVVVIARLADENSPFNGAPDWLIEICSSDQSTLDLQTKVLHCLSNGTQLAWLIDIERQQVWAWQGDNLPIIYAGDDPLPMLDNLPTLSVNVAIVMTQQR